MQLAFLVIRRGVVFVAGLVSLVVSILATSFAISISSPLDLGCLAFAENKDDELELSTGGRREYNEKYVDM